MLDKALMRSLVLERQNDEGFCKIQQEIVDSQNKLLGMADKCAKVNKYMPFMLMGGLVVPAAVNYFNLNPFVDSSAGQEIGAIVGYAATICLGCATPSTIEKYLEEKHKKFALNKESDLNSLIARDYITEQTKGLPQGTPTNDFYKAFDEDVYEYQNQIQKPFSYTQFLTNKELEKIGYRVDKDRDDSMPRLIDEMRRESIFQAELSRGVYDALVFDDDFEM